MKSFLIIDGNSIMNRAYYGVMNGKMLSNKDGLYTNAIYGFLNIYWMMLEKLKPDYVAVSFDLKAPTFRHEMFEDYKAQRKGMPEELKVQMPYIKEVLNAMTVPILELEGYEADDVLGTVSNENEKNNIFTYILTGDKDSFQLISDKTSVIIPFTKFGKTEYSTYTPDVLKENFLIEPYQVVHVKALMGDASDNIPGVSGIGEKTAYSLIEKYSTIDNLYNKVEMKEAVDLTEKVIQKLINDKDMALKSKELATIIRNVPIDINYEMCTLTEVDKPRLYELFKKLEFNKFMNRYDFSELTNENGKTGPNKEDVTIYGETILAPSKVIYLNSPDIKSKDDIVSLFENTLNEDKISYFFSEGTNKSGVVDAGKKILAIYSFKLDTVYVLNIDGSEYSNKIFKKFANCSSIKIGFNVKPDILYIFNNISDNVSGFKFDPMIAYYLLDSNRTSYDISYIISDIYGAELLTKRHVNESKQMSLFETESEDIKKDKLTENEEKNLNIYLKALFYSYDLIISKLKDADMLELFDEMEMPLAETLAYMENAGMYIDLKKLNDFDKEITISIEELQSKIHNIAGEVFNINSTQQLAVILFEKLKLPVVRKNKTGYSTDKEVLEELSDQHEIINYIFEYRQLVKLKTTYVDGLRNTIDSDGRIHTTFMQTVASTGRLSSVEPNLQNIPIRLELGRKVRSFFVGEKDHLIIDADYSQIELRILAHISSDHTMIDAFNNGIDIHTVTASQIFGVDISEVTKDMRSKAKAVNFGIVYGISDFGLSRNINISVKEASKYIDNYLLKYDKIKLFMDNIVKEAQEKGFVTTLFKRRRYIPELKQKNYNMVQFGKRIAMNTPIQGSAADIIKIAMNRIYKRLKEENLKSRLIMQVHDELIIEAVPEEVEAVEKIMRHEMENIIKLKVPLDVDLNVGKNWYDVK